MPFELEMPKLGKATGKRIYTYNGPGKVGNRKTLKITTNLELSFDLNANIGGAKVTGTLSITESSGTIHLDTKKGNVVSLNSAYSLSGDLNVSVNGMDIPVGTAQTQRISMELLKKLPK